MSDAPDNYPDEEPADVYSDGPDIGIEPRIVFPDSPERWTDMYPGNMNSMLLWMDELVAASCHL